jgi:aldehyde:ferredoxin oxidoreductase
MNGWMGRILRVDLSTGQTQVEPLDEGLARMYLGGRGLGARLLFSEVGPTVQPLSPENRLIFATGPLTGTRAQTSGRFSVTTKSPLTGTILDANSGGTWGVTLKRTGYDALIIQGASDRPVYLTIDEAGARVADAGELWGQTVSETTKRLGGRGRNVACIGPAGENQVLLSAIMNDGHRALGRGGVGAVMGAKRLKAVVVSGAQKPAVADDEALKFVVYEAAKLLKANPVTSQALPQFGTAMLVNLMNEAGVLPTRNFTESRFENAAGISGEALADRLLVRKTGCWGCPIACTRVTRTSRASGEGPEYETLWAFGAACGIGDLEAIAEANYLCNDLGLDTISAGATIACAMEMTERGILPGDLRFGRADLLAPTLRSMAYREGLGNELAEGSLRFARHRGVDEFAMQVKGMEMPAYDPRGMQGQGLQLATSNRGACHLRGNMLGPEILGSPKMVDRFAVNGKAGLVIVHQNLSAAIDSLVVCKFSGLALGDEHYARMLTAVTGLRFEPQDLMTIGERIWNLERCYNLREGFTAADDTLPRRLLVAPLDREASVDGLPNVGQSVQLAPMLKEYYRFRGWDANGAPTARKLSDLGLSDLGLESCLD